MRYMHTLRQVNVMLSAQVALYTGDTFSAKRFQSRLNQPSVFVLATIGP